MTRKRVEVHFDSDLYKDLKTIAFELEMTISELLRAFAQEKVVLHKKKSKRFSEIRNVLVSK